MGTRKPRDGIVVRGTEKKYDDTGRLDHIAFAATDVDGVRKRTRATGGRCQGAYCMAGVSFLCSAYGGLQPAEVWP